MRSADKLLGILTAATNSFYVFWLCFAVRGPLGIFLVVAEAMIVSLTILFIFNHWVQASRKPPKNTPKGTLDVFITVVDEPLIMLELTVKAAAKIGYAEKKVYVLDDGDRDQVRELAERYGAKYVRRPERCDRKAGNLNYGMANSSGEYILVLDSDQIVEENIADDLLGYFADDEKLALVITRQRFRAPKKDFNHDNLFYDQMQVGKDNDNAAISCGSGVIYRRKALDRIGGFQTWNLVEDLYTSYVFHQNGFRSVYVNRPYTTGTAPWDLQVIFSQRGRWALDTLRIFFHKSPLFQSGLKPAQRMHYFEIGWAYIVSALALPVLFILPPLTLITGQYILSDPATYILIRAPTITLILLFYYRLSNGTFQTSQFWASLSPIYLDALMKAVSAHDIRKCTIPNANLKSQHIRRRNLHLIMPHLIYLVLSILIVVWRITLVDHAITSFIAINALWITVMAFWFAPVVYRELLGCHYCTYEELPQ